MYTIYNVFDLKNETDELISDIITLVAKIENSINGFGANTIARKLTERGTQTKGAQSYKRGINIKDKINGIKVFKSKEKILWRTKTVLGILQNPIYYGGKT